MNMKKTFSIFLAFVLLLGIVVPCFPVKAETAHQHTYGQWTIDTVNHSQSRTCSDCGGKQVLHGTTNKAEQANAPAVGDSYYLAANVNGTLKYFYLSGSVTVTNPYSLNTTENPAEAKLVTLVTETVADSGDFRMNFDNNGTSSYVYCRDENSDGKPDTGTRASGVTASRCSFSMDEVNGVAVIREYGDDYVLAVKKVPLTAGGEAWRMLGVAQSELGTEGVYPVMMVTNHTHNYGTDFESDDNKHWKACDCGDRTEEAAHTYSAWTFDTAKGTQSRACSCGKTEVLHGTTNKATQVTAPVVGGKYYLAANVDGTLKYFTFGNSTTDTIPYSLHVFDDPANASQITLEAPATGATTGFQLTFSGNNGALARIYCYDAKNSDGVMDTGHNTSGPTQERHTFDLAEVSGVKVLQKQLNDNVLVVKYNADKGTYRMLGVPASQLGNEGVYPAMLVVNHTHTYGTAYEKDETQHWKVCDCGNASIKENHEFTDNKCVCGAESAPHDCQSTDGKWYENGDKHYQLCGTCGDKINEAGHTYGGWTFDSIKGTQSKLCTACESVGETLYGTTNKATQVTAPAIGGNYYLAANVNGSLKYFTFGNSTTDTIPYSLHVFDDPANATRITLEAPATGATTGFQLSFSGNNGTLTRIYCFDAKNSDGVMDTGHNTSGPTQERHTFDLAEVSGVKVLQKQLNDNVLVVKYNADKGTYRMLGVPASELGNEGVYPAMLVVNHTHNYGTTYKFDDVQHWQVCDCGTTTQKVAHNYVADPALGYSVCVCGATLAPHDCENTDGEWHADGDKHYQLCGKCGDKINEAGHTYGDWIFDTEEGSQSKLCGVCQHAGETLHGTTDKVAQVAAPAVGGTYYLVANVDGQLFSFTTGGATETSPYSMKTTKTLNKVTLNAALEAGRGEFQLVSDSGYYIYSVSEGAGTTVSVNYINDPAKVSFSMDQVNGVQVIRAFGTKNILVAKYSETMGTFRIWCLPESELANEGVYPVMLANLHQHSPKESFDKDSTHHWHFCPTCYGKVDAEEHEFVKNAAGDRVCKCGAVQAPHDCQSGDGKWYSAAGKHYQLCGVCQEKIREADHTYGNWTFDTAKGTQKATCSVCNTTETLHGTGEKGYQVLEAEVGESYHLAANVNGKLYFFRQGTVSDTVPYSLVVTDDVNHDMVVTVKLEDYTAAEGATAGFQLTYHNPANEDKLTRIYCFDSLTDSAVAGQTGIMDTGVNTASPTRNRHNFKLDVVNGVTVLRKASNNNILVVKYDPAVEAYRMLGVPESELANEGVYPAMLMNLHQHTHTDETYHSDNLGHWFSCSCGGKSNYEDHTVTKWKYTTVPTQTTGGRKTGTCTTCGSKAVVDVPAMVAEGHYYLTGKLGGKTYYFRDRVGDESVEETAPFSLMTSDKEKDALKVDVAWDEKSNTYVLSYTVTRTLNIYMGDVNGSKIQKDGKVDLSSSGTTDETLITFRWDPKTKMFYQLEGGVRYVIGFKKMTFTDGKTKAVRMLAVPENELGGDIAPMQLKVVHLHEISDKWHSDAVNHWQECSCGMHKNEGAHNVPKWTVEKKATDSAAGKKSGTCTICNKKVVNAIPMLTDKIKAPANGGTYYLTGTLNGKQYYFCHTPLGGSVADTYPYSLYTDPGTGVVTPLTVKVKSGNYTVSYAEPARYLYISTDGVGMTSQVDKTMLVNYQWDEENKVLYQMEGDVKHVLVFKMMRNNKDENLVRITSMPLERALIDASVAIARFTTNRPTPAEVSNVPKDATLLKEVSADAGEDVPDVQPDVEFDGADKNSAKLRNLFIAVAIVAIVVPGVILLLMALKNSVFGLAFFRKWNVWAGISVMAAGVVLLGAMILPNLLKPGAPGLEKFTIVANETTMKEAEALAVEIYEDHGISLPVVHSKDFDGEYGIYLNVTGFNSYGGYKYSISSENDANGTGVYIDGTGVALETAISKWTKSLRKALSFPFGMEDDVVGYEWNTGDVNMTGLGFELKEMNSRELYEGVEMRELKYESFAYGKNTGYAVIIDADAPVELRVSAGEWDENTTPDNPGKKYTVQNHGKRLTEAGYEVIAITNAGFYDLNGTKTYIPWGMQIVDGLVKKEPNKDNPKNTDNWFAQTGSGKYVISNTDGYYETYETTLANGVGGGLLLMENGKPCFTSTTPDYRTVVGITKDGDLVMLTISGANYAVVTQAFMDMQIDVDCILNLDGGGSTTLHALTEEGKLQQYICETPVEREVADAIAIVKKK